MKSVLITGANRGLGLEFARHYRELGWKVVGTCRNPNDAAELANTGAEIATLDVTSDESVKALRARYDTDSFDLIIANSGVGTKSEGLVVPELAEFRKVVETNALGALRFVAAFADTLERKKGKLIVISSRRGSISELWNVNELAYGMSKAALNFMSRAAALTLKPKGIAVLVLTPGHVRTDMGGPSGKISAEESVSGMRAVIDRIDLNETGSFYSYTGEKVNW